MEKSVLVCVDDDRIRDVIALLLEEEGYTTASTDVTTWFASDTLPASSFSAMILDTWPLRSASVAAQAGRRSIAQAIPLILLVENPLLVPHTLPFGAVATLPLCFSFDELLAAVQQAMGNVPPAAP